MHEDVYKRQAQYLFIFCGGLLALFILFVILYMVGIDQWICIVFGAASSSVVVWQTFALDVYKRQRIYSPVTASTGNGRASIHQLRKLGS